MEEVDNRIRIFNGSKLQNTTSSICNFLRDYDKGWHSSDKLKAVYNLTGSELRTHIREIRRHGFPIASSHKGYKWATSEIEIDKTIEHLQLRAISLQKTVHGLKKSKDKI